MKKLVLVICGWFFVTLGALGIILPLLPTTPFMLLAAICFSASSKKAYNFLVNNCILGPYIEHYRTKRGVSIAAKLKAIIMLWIFLIISAVLTAKLWAAIVLAVVGTGVTIHLLLLKTQPRMRQKLTDQNVEP